MNPKDRALKVHREAPQSKPSTFGPLGSRVVAQCQLCGSQKLKSVLFLGFLPPVNTMPNVDERPKEQPAYPAELLRCLECELFQLGSVVRAEILFPPSYPYTSGTTKILRDNFAEMYREVMSRYPLSKSDLVVDIGSNDGTLLSNFATGHRALGIEPTNAGKLALDKGIATYLSFFNAEIVQRALDEHGRAKLVTATNVFAHIDDVHAVVENILTLLDPRGIFVSESHYLLSLVETVQYDTIYHEHLRYYSLTALQNLLNDHGLEVVHVKRIPTHGGSIRVYSARKGVFPVRETVLEALAAEARGLSDVALQTFKKRVVQSKLDLHALLKDIRAKGQRVFGVGAPSRASTLINYVGLDDGILDCVTEIQGSYKIGKYIPGTLIPVVDEARLYSTQPEYALLLSWHIADELIPKLTQKGFKGDFIVPLPIPRIVKNPG